MPTTHAAPAAPPLAQAPKVPLCKDCRHFQPASHPLENRFDRCLHPLHGVDVVRGEPNAPTCESARRSLPPRTLTLCGPEGLAFESAHPGASSYPCTADS